MRKSRFTEEFKTEAIKQVLQAKHSTYHRHHVRNQYCYTAQMEGVEAVRKALENMDRGTLENTCLVEEMATAAATMKGQAIDLVAGVSLFKLDAFAKPDLKVIGYLGRS